MRPNSDAIPAIKPSRLALVLLIVCTAPLSVIAANWPHWRGPNGDGTTDSVKNLPDTWGPNENILWKQEMPAWSGSSPVIWGDRIFVNSPSKEEATPEPTPAPAADGTRRRPFPRKAAMAGPGGQDILVMCLDRATGNERWRKQYDRGNEIKMKHNMSSPTPVTDGKLVWVVSGNGMVACFDFNGNETWKFDFPAKFGKLGTQFGQGSSPLLLDGMLVIQVLQGLYTDDPSYLFALKATTGDIMWRVDRPTDGLHETPDAYTSPIVLENKGKKQIVISGGGYITGHALDTGAEIWRGGGLNPGNEKNYRVISSPLVRDGMIFAPTRQRPLLAFKAGGTGDISTSHLAWKWTGDNGPDVPTPVSDGPRFYMAADSGRLTCLDAKTGAVIYGPHDTGIGRSSSSPILAGGKIYFTGETGETAVIQAGPTYQLIAKNSLDGSYTLSTPAFADGQIFLRTGTHLYCIGKQ